MYIHQKAYDNAIQKIRIEFGTLIGLGKDDEAFVVLKELPTLDTMQLNEAHQKGQTELLKFFKEVLPRIIVEHNLYETEEKKMSPQQVTDFIFEKLDVTSKVVSDYASSTFFTRQNKTEDR